MSQQQQQKAGTDKDGSSQAVLVASSIAANFLAIFNAFSGDKKIPLFITAAAVVLGGVVLIREYGKPFRIKTMLAFGSVVAGFTIGVFTLLGGSIGSQPTPTPIPAPTPIPTPTTTVTSIPITTTSPPPSSFAEPPPPPVNPSDPPLLFDGIVRLDSKTGADVETGQKSGTIEGTYSEGRNDPEDIYLDFVGLLQVSGGGVYEYPHNDTEAEAYQTCNRYTSDGRPPKNGFALSNFKFCFVTSDNRLGWISVGDAVQLQYAEMDVKVWDKKVGGN